MITITDNAISELMHLRNQMGMEDQTLRLVPQPTPEGVAFGLAPDEQRDGDQVVENDGNTVLVIDSFTSEQLDGVVMDAVDTPEGMRLALRRDEEAA